MGGSQGGGLALACAALEPSVARVASQYPFLCDWLRVWELDLAVAELGEMDGGYVAEFRPEDKVEPRDDQLRRVGERFGLGYSIPERCLGPDVYGIWSVGET